MKKVVIVLCVIAMLLAVFGGVAAVKLVQTREQLAQRYFDEWYALFRMTELIELRAKDNGDSLLYLINHVGNYGLSNWHVEALDIRIFLQDYEQLLRVVADTKNPQLVEDSYILLMEVNGKMKEICGSVLNTCQGKNKILPDDPAATKAMDDLLKLYQEYQAAMEEIAIRFNAE